MALVSDFGIAAVAAGEVTREGAAGLTLEGSTPGTPRYASPEQIVGGPLDARSDLYSLACVVFEMLAGRPAFDAPSAEGLARQHLGAEPPTLLELGQIVPPAVSAALARALARDPDQRFGTAARFAEALTVPASAVITPAAAGAASPPNNLPRERTRFVGRDRERAEGARLLESSRLLTLTGIGGSGKTRLALRLAADTLAAFPDGAWFVDLAPLQDPQRVATAVAEAVGLREEPGVAPEAALVRQWTGRRALLVLDNCEHLRDAVARLADHLLAGSDHLRMLATSRESLGVAGERPWAVGSLDLPAAGAGAETAIAEADAVRLFVDRAQAADPRFTLDADTAPVVAEICRRLDGIPLALELAAARVRILSVGQVLERLDDRFRLLAGGGRGAPGRHASLEAALDGSYVPLEPDEARLFRALCVFAGGWTLEAAAAVADPAADGAADEFAVMNLLGRLVDRSLVIVGRERNEAPRYGMLETVRQYARERLVAAGEAPAVEARHAAFFSAQAERAWNERFAREEFWAAWLESEHDNLRAVLDAGRGGDDERVLELAGALSWFWHAHSHLREGSERLAAALAATAPGPPRPARARALRGAAVLSAWRQDPAATRAGMEEGLAMWRALGDRAETALALEGMGWAAILDGRDEEARELFVESLRLQEEGGDPRLILRAQVGVGQALVALGEVEPARALAHAIVAGSVALGDRRSEHLGHHYLADCMLIEGRCALALPGYQAALRLARTIGDRVEMGFEVQGVAMALAGLGRAEAALRYAAAAAAEWERLDARPGGVRFWEGLLERWLGPARRALDPATRARVEDEGRALPFDEVVERAANETLPNPD
jgi:non-specific serine/threonine protein kinase